MLHTCRERGGGFILHSHKHLKQLPSCSTPQPRRHPHSTDKHTALQVHTIHNTQGQHTCKNRHIEVKWRRKTSKKKKKNLWKQIKNAKKKREFKDRWVLETFYEDKETEALIKYYLNKKKCFLFGRLRVLNFTSALFFLLYCCWLSWVELVLVIYCSTTEEEAVKKTITTLHFSGPLLFSHRRHTSLYWINY